MGTTKLSYGLKPILLNAGVVSSQVKIKKNNDYLSLQSVGLKN